MFFLESVPFQLHARMLISYSAESIKSYEHFSDLGVDIALSHRHAKKTLMFSGKTNTAIHVIGEVDMARR